MEDASLWAVPSSFFFVFLPAYNYAEHLGNSKMPLVCAPCFNTSVVAAIVPFCLYALWTCMLDIPTSSWFHLKSFYCLICALFIIFITIPTHALHTSPAHTCKEALPVASNSWLVILYTRKQATELCDELQSPRCMFAISITTTMY